jgi:hypothetical protein
LPSEKANVDASLAEKILWLLLHDKGPVKIRHRRLDDSYDGCHLRIRRIDNEYSEVTARGYND